MHGNLVDLGPINAALGRMMGQSTREFEVVGREVMRGVVGNLIAVTPPGHANADGGLAKHAESYGRAAVALSIRSLYGTPNAAVELVQQQDFGASMRMHKELRRGNVTEANKIFQQHGGPGIYEFDGGTLHKRYKKGRRFTGTARPPIFYVSRVKPLNDYIKEIQTRVGWLASGWNEAAAELGIKPPEFIWKHGGPGTIAVIINDEVIDITATNLVRYASEAADMDRRIEYALRKQTEAINRRVDDAFKKLAIAAGFVLTA